MITSPQPPNYMLGLGLQYKQCVSYFRAFAKKIKKNPIDVTSDAFALIITFL